MRSLAAKRAALQWAGLAALALVPVLLAATSPLLAWRSWIYIAACFAGIAALAMLLFQPLLVAGFLPGIAAPAGRKWHRLGGALLVALVIIHVAGLWISSPPDVIDALTFTSPTPFSPWGVTAMWAVFFAGFFAALRKPLRISVKTWRLVHTALASIIVTGSIVHALLVEGTMEPISKIAIGIEVFAAAMLAFWKLRAWALFKRRPASP